jgi:Tfp pilus assembly protein PilV
MSARTPKQYHAQRGFLVIEAAIAFLLVSLGIIGLVLLSAKNSRASQESFERTEAVQLATQISTKIRSSGDGLLEWHQVDVSDSSTWVSTDPATLTALGELKDKLTQRLSAARAVITLAAPGGGGVACTASPCEVLVQVNWTGASSQPRSYELYTWVGLQ